MSASYERYCPRCGQVESDHDDGRCLIADSRPDGGPFDPDPEDDPTDCQGMCVPCAGGMHEDCRGFECACWSDHALWWPNREVTA